MASGRPVYKFGPFRLDAGKRVLLCDGHAVPLTSKALDILLALVESHGELVEKGALFRRVWPDTFVEEGNLTFNIHLLRKALGDDRSNGNRFIETVPRRGYRFVAAVEVATAEPAAPPGQPAQPVAEIGPGQDARATATEPPMAGSHSSGARRGRPIFAKVAIVPVALIVIGIAARFVVPPTAPHVTAYQQLTHTSGGLGTPVTDGVRVYFAQEGQLYAVSVKGGEAVRIPTPFPVGGIVDISPDKSQLLVGMSGHRSLWTLPVPGGQPALIVDGSDNGSWSPDGRGIAYLDGYDLDVVSSDGYGRRRLTTLPGPIDYLQWRADGRELCFVVAPKGSEKTLAKTLWEVDADGANLQQLALPGIGGDPGDCRWTPDGRYLYFTVLKTQTREELWALRQQGFSWRRTLRLAKLIDSPHNFDSPVADPTGRKLFARGQQF